MFGSVRWKIFKIFSKALVSGPVREAKNKKKPEPGSKIKLCLKRVEFKENFSRI